MQERDTTTVPNHHADQSLVLPYSERPQHKACSREPQSDSNGKPHPIEMQTMSDAPKIPSKPVFQKTGGHQMQQYCSAETYE
jgi:hypothetical protein